MLKRLVRLPPARLLVATLLLVTGGAAYIDHDPDETHHVTAYHADAARSGVYVVPNLTWRSATKIHRDQSFDGAVPGVIQAQPLYWHWRNRSGGAVIVATDRNIVAALDARTGRTIWRATLGPAVPGTTLACGGPVSVGITGTPVIDPANETLYADALVASEAGPRHLVFAVSLRDGSIRPGWPIAVSDQLGALGTAFDAGLQHQRGALALVGRRLFVPYGGMQDCGDYHGFVVAIDVDQARAAAVWRTKGQKGGVWAQGGVVSDGRSVFFATGNTDNALDWSDGEAIFRLDADLTRASDPDRYFAPSDWRRLDDDDADLGGTTPVLVDTRADGAPRRLIMAFGKNGKAYVLDADDLGGIGGELIAKPASEGPIVTSPAVIPAPGGAMVALHTHGPLCPNEVAHPGVSMLAVTLGPPVDVHMSWCGEVDGSGAPIMTVGANGSNPIVWIVGAEGDGRLHGFRADTGAVLFGGGGRGDAMTGIPRFATILAAGDRLYVGGEDKVYAFRFAP